MGVVVVAVVGGGGMIRSDVAKRHRCGGGDGRVNVSERVKLAEYRIQMAEIKKKKKREIENTTRKRD